MSSISVCTQLLALYSTAAAEWHASVLLLLLQCVQEGFLSQMHQQAPAAGATSTASVLAGTNQTAPAHADSSSAADQTSSRATQARAHRQIVLRPRGMQ